MNLNEVIAKLTETKNQMGNCRVVIGNVHGDTMYLDDIEYNPDDSTTIFIIGGTTS